MRTKKIHQLINWIAAMLFMGVSAMAQTSNPYIGNWEGKFMEEFKAIIRINMDAQRNFTGKILMYAGDAQIQNDELSNFGTNEDRISFFIAAKETQFEGVINMDNSELSGHFIFPDGSKHLLTAYKSDSDVQSIPSESYLEMKHKKYPQSELKADLQFLLNKLEENHPQLYAYTSKPELETKVKSAMNNIREPMTLEEFYLLITPIADAVKCSHTGIRIPDDYQKLLQQNGKSFPLKLAFSGERAYYLGNLGEVNFDINPGTEVMSINDLTVKHIITQLLPLFPSEGNNRTTKYNQLNHHFSSYYQLLDASESYKIEFGDEKADKIIIVDGIVMEELLLEPDRNSTLDFTIDSSNNTGILKISAFSFPDINAYIQLTDSIFQTLKDKSIDNLVLDLRDNPGGHPIYAAQLLSYLIDHEFTYFKQNPAIPEFETLYHPMQPNEPRFDGNVYVLINGGCLSTTGHLISLLKYHTKARFIGEQPGSTYSCNDQSQRFILPNTGIEANIPRTTFETAVLGFEKDQPFPLDYEINTSIKTLVNGQDAYLDFVFNLIGQNQ